MKISDIGTDDAIEVMVSRDSIKVINHTKRVEREFRGQIPGGLCGLGRKIAEKITSSKNRGW